MNFSHLLIILGIFQATPAYFLKKTFYQGTQENPT